MRFGLLGVMDASSVHPVAWTCPEHGLVSQTLVGFQAYLSTHVGEAEKSEQAISF